MKWPAGSFSGGTVVVPFDVVVFAVVVVRGVGGGAGVVVAAAGGGAEGQGCGEGDGPRDVPPVVPGPAGRVGIERRYTPSCARSHHVISCRLDPRAGAHRCRFREHRLADPRLIEQVFDAMVEGWAGRTRRSRGRSWSGGCRAAARARSATTGCPRAPTAATARPGPASVRPTSRRPDSWRRAGVGARTPSCTATRTSASSTAPRTPRSWPRRRPGSVSRRWRSPTTTASTAWSASPRRPGRSGCRPSSAPS